MTFFLLALAGLPPTVGFTGKVLILASSVFAGYAWLAGISDRRNRDLGLRVLQDRPHDVRARRAARRCSACVHPASPLPWIGVAACAAVATLVLGLYPFAPSDVVPLVK